MTFVDEGFALSSSGPFDPGYMTALFEYGYEQAASRAAFGKTPASFPKQLRRSFAGRKLPDLR